MRCLLVVSLLISCRVSIETVDRSADAGAGRACKVNPTSLPCMDAVTHSDLAWIQSNVFDGSCIFSNCHNGAATDAGKTDLRAGASHAHLVGVASPVLDPTRTLVVPNNVQASFLMLMVGDVPPEMASPPTDSIPTPPGLMPMDSGGQPLCCQKLDALERWIMAGAPND